jgi:hypothetical protein
MAETVFMVETDIYARVTSNQGASNLRREQYDTTCADPGLFFIVDMIGGRAAGGGGVLTMAAAPPKQLRVLATLIEERRPMTAKELGVTASTVEAARRLIEKPPGARGRWRTIKTIRGETPETTRYHFDPEPELRWALVDHPKAHADGAAIPGERQAASPLVTLSAASAVYSAFDSKILVQGANIVNRSPRGCTVKRWEVSTSIQGAQVVFVASKPSRSFSPGEPWLRPGGLRLNANDGAQGALHFSTLGHDPGSFDSGPAQLCAILGDDTRLEVEIELRRFPLKPSK